MMVEAQVQKRASHEEYLIYVTAGMSNMQYTLANGGEASSNPGFGLGMDYVYNVSSTLGFSFGFELSSYGGQAKYRSLTETYSALDDKNKSMEYTYSLDNYLERQNLLLLSVPVMVRFRIPAGRHDFYLAGGMKFGFPLASRVMISADNIYSSGYYWYENLHYSNLPEHGFFSGYDIREEKSDIRSFTTMTTFAAEGGMRFNLGRHLLYTGLYFDYCLNNSNNGRNKHPVNYFSEVKYESVLNSSLASKLNLMSFGVKVRFSLF